MQNQKISLKEFKPILILLYLSVTGFLCIFSVQRYLHLPIELVSCLSFMAITFGVYTLNRFTDAEEDFTNDIGRMIFFQKKKSFLFLAILSLAGSFGYLIFVQKLNWMHLAILAIGIGYSYRVIPWFSKEKGLELYRIKDMTLIKNLAVSFLWGASVFVLPILYARATFNFLDIGLLALGLFISTLNNTLFDDILDEPGDKIAKIKTMPVTFGVVPSQLALITIDIIWIGLVSIFFFIGKINLVHYFFLTFLGLYPFLYIGMNLSGKVPKKIVDLISEMDLFLFTLGMFLLSFY